MCFNSCYFYAPVIYKFVQNVFQRHLTTSHSHRLVKLPTCGSGLEVDKVISRSQGKHRQPQLPIGQETKSLPACLPALLLPSP